MFNIWIITGLLICGGLILLFFYSILKRKEVDIVAPIKTNFINKFEQQKTIEEKITEAEVLARIVKEQVTTQHPKVVIEEDKDDDEDEDEEDWDDEPEYQYRRHELSCNLFSGLIPMLVGLVVLTVVFITMMNVVDQVNTQSSMNISVPGLTKMSNTFDNSFSFMPLLVTATIGTVILLLVTMFRNI